jgi:hypothetical protein
VAMNAPVNRIRLSIDTLVLRGVRPEDRHAVARGLNEELTRLLGQPGVAPGWARGGSLPVLRLPRLHLKSAPTAQTLGVQVGRAIGRSLKP